jgi:hypothetical protein
VHEQLNFSPFEIVLHAINKKKIQWEIQFYIHQGREEHQITVGYIAGIGSVLEIITMSTEFILGHYGF